MVGAIRINNQYEERIVEKSKGTYVVLQYPVVTSLSVK
jgi:hypothetical protein